MSSIKKAINKGYWMEVLDNLFVESVLETNIPNNSFLVEEAIKNRRNDG